MTNKLFDAHWQNTKALLLKGSDLETNQDGSENLNKRIIMAELLENHRKIIIEKLQNKDDDVNEQINPEMNKVILPIVRRVSPTIIANEIVGVQILSDKNEIANNRDEMVPVSIMNRNLAARWTFEAAGNYTPPIGENGEKLDIEAEIMAALAQELTAELDQEILCYLINLIKCKPHDTLDFWALSKNADGSYKPSFDYKQFHGILVTMINHEMNQIRINLRKKHDWF